MEEFQLASLPRLTYDKLQLTCLEPPSWCVTQPHLAGRVGYDISPPARKILLLSCLSKAPMASRSTVSMQQSAEADWINWHKMHFTYSTCWTDECVTNRLRMEAMWDCVYLGYGAMRRTAIRINKLSALDQIQLGWYQSSTLCMEFFIKALQTLSCFCTAPKAGLVVWREFVCFLAMTQW